MTDLPGPPWRSFPRTRVAQARELYRITRRRNDDGSARTPWYFSSTGSADAGRFDLPPPRGSCYYADVTIGAFVEVYRRVHVIARSDVASRHVVVATRTGDALPLANFASARAAAFGVTVDQFAGDDYTATQQLADKLSEAGFAGISAPARHDPSLQSRTVALFGRAGPARSQHGWRTRQHDVDADPGLLVAAREYGYAVLDVPFDVPTTPPPQRPRRRRQ